MHNMLRKRSTNIIPQTRRR